MRRRIILVIAIVLAFSGCISFGGSDETTEAPAPAAEDTSTLTTTATESVTAGTAVTTGPAAPTARAWATNRTANGFLINISGGEDIGRYDGLAREGNTILRVNLSVTNTENSQQEAPYWESFVLLLGPDGSATQIEPLNVGTFGYSTVQPGATYEGTILYEVEAPIDETNMEVRYTATDPPLVWNSSTSIVQRISPETSMNDSSETTE